MSIIKTEAIVLKQFDLGEADKIITFYTKDYGKVRAVAKGVRKSRSSLSGIVLPFNYNYMTFYQTDSLDRINQVKNVFTFAKLREDLSKMAYASFMAELIEKVGLENDPNQDLFSLLLSSLHQLLNEKEYNYIELSFKVRLLGILGFKPELDSCISCKKELIYYRKNIFDIEHGGLLCTDCYRDRIENISTNNCVERKQNTEQSNEYSNRSDSNINKYILYGESIQVLNDLFETGLKPATNLKISNKAFRQLDDLINKFMIYHLDLKLKSFDFLNMIKNLG
ncbi:MAG: DNA repair protein RecO [Halanaerobiales bacterium]